MASKEKKDRKPRRTFDLSPEDKAKVEDLRKQIALVKYKNDFNAWRRQLITKLNAIKSKEDLEDRDKIEEMVEVLKETIESYEKIFETETETD